MASQLRSPAPPTQPTGALTPVFTISPVPMARLREPATPLTVVQGLPAVLIAPATLNGLEEVPAVGCPTPFSCDVLEAAVLVLMRNTVNSVVFMVPERGSRRLATTGKLAAVLESIVLPSHSSPSNTLSRLLCVALRN